LGYSKGSDNRNVHSYEHLHKKHISNKYLNDAPLAPRKTKTWQSSNLKMEINRED
jgi:hypothetical protein